MTNIVVMKNTVLDYAWGSLTAIPELLGESNSANIPQAEMWLGAHPKAPSLVSFDGGWKSLLNVIETYPEKILGRDAARRFDKKLPYLLKVLAAAKPLSIQAHPSADQAREGFERENGLAIPLDAPDRNYKDENHKPECLCALEPFWAMCGFRPIKQIVELMLKVCPLELAGEIKLLQSSEERQGLESFFKSLLTMDSVRQNRIIREVLKNVANLSNTDNPAFKWILKLAADYPRDIGILSPVYLNLIRLKPGQALFLPAGVLHAYLEGTGIELMANSDNVLRGGLTPKHIDAPELLKVLIFESSPIEVLQSRKIQATETVYPTPAKEFVLSKIVVTSEKIYSSSASHNVEIILCTEGIATIEVGDVETTLELQRGMSALVPAAAGAYWIKGDASFFKAAIPSEDMIC